MQFLPNLPKWIFRSAGLWLKDPSYPSVLTPEQILTILQEQLPEGVTIPKSTVEREMIKAGWTQLTINKWKYYFNPFSPFMAKLQILMKEGQTDNKFQSEG